MEANTMDCDTPTALRFLASSAKQAEAEWMRKAADEIERLVGLAAFASPDMVKWLTDQVMRRDNVIEAMKSAGMEQITKAFTENRWIPVAERLPIEQPIKEGFREARVLAWDGEEVYEACYTAFHDPRDDGWSAFRSPPTHWMPLPEPPQPEAES